MSDDPGGIPARKKLKLLFVHEVNWRKKPVYEMHDFPELLSLRGHKCVFVDFPEGDPKTGLSRFLDLRTRVQPGLCRAHEGARVEVRTPGRVLPPPFDRFAATVTHVPALRRALANEKFDAVVSYAVPTNGWQLVMLANHFGIPLLFRAIDVSHLLRKTRLGPLIHAAECYIYRHADAVSANNPALRRYCIENGARAESTSVEYPGLDLIRFAPLPRNPELSKRYGIEPHHRVAMFMGTLYRFAGLDWFLENFAPVLRRRPEYRVLFVGGGEEEAKLAGLSRQLGIEHQVIITGFISYPELADHMRLGDVGFNTFKKSIVTDCALPSKVVQYLGCGIPTVCTPLDGLQEMLEGHEAGIRFAELNDQFISAIEAILDDDEQRNHMSHAGRAATERLFQWDANLMAFENAIFRTINWKRRRVENLTSSK